MSRYTTRLRTQKRSWDDDWDAFSQETMTVHEQTEEPTPTGLLDKHGNEYFREPEPKRIGFWPKGHGIQTEE